MKIRDLAENVQQDLALALPHAPWGPEAFERYTRGRLPPTLLVQQGSDTDQSELNMEATAQSGGQTHALRSRPDLWTKISLPFAICAMLVPVEKDKVMIWTRHDGRVIDEDGMVRLIDDFEQMVVGVAESLGEDGGGSGSTTVAEVCPAAFA